MNDCRGRKFQFGVKYWAACCAALICILTLSQDVPAVRPWGPVNVLFTIVVILSEKARAGFHVLQPRQA